MLPLGIARIGRREPAGDGERLPIDLERPRELARLPVDVAEVVQHHGAAALEIEVVGRPARKAFDRPLDRVQDAPHGLGADPDHVLEPLRDVEDQIVHGLLRSREVRLGAVLLLPGQDRAAVGFAPLPARERGKRRNEDERRRRHPGPLTAQPLALRPLQRLAPEAEVDELPVRPRQVLGALGQPALRLRQRQTHQQRVRLLALGRRLPARGGPPRDPPSRSGTRARPRPSRAAPPSAGRSPRAPPRHRARGPPASPSPADGADGRTARTTSRHSSSGELRARPRAGASARRPPAPSRASGSGCAAAAPRPADGGPGRRWRARPARRRARPPAPAGAARRRRAPPSASTCRRAGTTAAAARRRPGPTPRPRGGRCRGRAPRSRSAPRAGRQGGSPPPAAAPRAAAAR